RNEQRITIGILTASEEVGATIEPVDGEPVTIPWENIGEGKVVFAEVGKPAAKSQAKKGSRR
ncbi:MAG: hypothetical protein OEM52_14760, partial [bacterium]|nr:hypothetical protein [bacterium]